LLEIRTFVGVKNWRGVSDPKKSVHTCDVESWQQIWKSILNMANGVVITWFNQFTDSN